MCQLVVSFVRHVYLCVHVCMYDYIRRHFTPHARTHAFDNMRIAIVPVMFGITQRMIVATCCLRRHLEEAMLVIFIIN